MTQKNILVAYLRSRPRDWIPAYQLRSVRTPFGWLGHQADRRARELAEAGLVERKIEGKYSYYRALAPKRIEVITDKETGEVLRRVPVYG